MLELTYDEAAFLKKWLKTCVDPVKLKRLRLTKISTKRRKLRFKFKRNDSHHLVDVLGNQIFEDLLERSNS